ncbi:cobalamin B12-binding domain-containing protein [Ectothiorhodospira magna]|nr:cobalamin B12-binding domain-containing protein [Ectothiorhodospira magna]
MRGGDAPGTPPVGRAAHADNDHPQDLLDQDTRRLRTELSRVIEGEIIPRLMLVHRARGPEDGHCAKARTPDIPMTPDVQVSSIGTQAVETFSHLVMAQDTDAISSYLDTLRGRGVSLEIILVQLLAPTARYLGELWETDQADFTEVTVGLCRLQHLLRELGSAFEAEPGHGLPGQKRVLMAPVPGEHHTFGLLMVSEFFRRAGWEVTCDPALGVTELNDLVRREWFDVVALSLSCEPLLERAASVIRGVRRASCNPSVGILIGGRLFANNPALGAVVGADQVAINGQDAVQRADEMLARQVGRVNRQLC